MRFKITKEDLQLSKVLSPGWYICRVSKVERNQTSKSSGANQDIVHFSVADDPKNPKLKDGGSSSGVPIKPIYISEAGNIGYSFPFFAALTGKPLAEGEEIDTDLLSNAVDRKLRIFVENTEFGGRVSNSAKEFKAL